MKMEYDSAFITHTRVWKSGFFVLLAEEKQMSRLEARIIET